MRLGRHRHARRRWRGYAENAHNYSGSSARACVGIQQPSFSISSRSVKVCGMQSQLTVSQVTHQYEPPTGPVVLQDVSFEAAPGATIAIVGPSGSGKSTLLNLIGSLDKPTAGTIRLGEMDVTALAGNAIARYRAAAVGFVFQDHHLLPQLSGLENVLLPTLAIGGASQARERARELIERVGVAARAHAFPAQLSGGERQRIAVARAFINQPRLLLCDEPTGNLDHDNAVKVVELFVELARQQQVIIVMATHNLELAARFDRCLELSAGSLVAGGKPPAGARR